jgi:hypothetical protein
MSNSELSASDLVWGAGAIAKVIGRPISATYHMLERGFLPAKRIGGRWAASRQRLLAIADPAEPAA